MQHDVDFGGAVPGPVECECRFGSVAGICCGIFVVKGLKAVAFLLGGLFVTLQVRGYYGIATNRNGLAHSRPRCGCFRTLQWMSSKSMARVNWGSVESGYNSAVDRLSGSNVQKGKGNLKKVFDRSIQFLLADFPQRGMQLSPLLLIFWSSRALLNSYVSRRTHSGNAPWIGPEMLQPIQH